ncbi:MAG: imidazoleglycerol-phosphate dehydratase HisB [Desulfobacterota bacterium]|nr:imidazoleglycerol-phosphate dehydratase HisB [Thermodesulfobacteriota bacterium]MDW8001677.1 imidazoleglycerol-phosphate dehydratase HisB [Deltaproteobacteria bacterium]
MTRRSDLLRKTKETEIKVSLNVEGEGKYRIVTPVPFLNHMLELFAKHGNFDLEIEATGDVNVDPHHTVEDLGYALGASFYEALGDKRGVNRYGYALIPMDETLCLFALDLSGRPHLAVKGSLKGFAGSFDTGLIVDFFWAFVNESKMTIHIHILSGRNPHHKIEAIFKAFGKAMRMAVDASEKQGDIPSTKGVL